jgi:hypothetical protein
LVFYSLSFDTYLPIRIKIAASSATIPKMTLGIASPGIKAVTAIKIRYTARKIKPILLISFIKNPFKFVFSDDLNFILLSCRMNNAGIIAMK